MKLSTLVTVYYSIKSMVHVRVHIKLWNAPSPYVVMMIIITLFIQSSQSDDVHKYLKLCLLMMDEG